MTLTNEIQTTVSEYLHGMILESDELENFLNALTRLAVHELSETGEEVLCGITLLRHKRAGTVASSSETAQEMDEVQYKYKDGPCLSASRTQALVEVPDLASDGRWPTYSEYVVGQGIRSVLAIPFELEIGDGAALNLYSSLPGDFTAAKVALAQEYARKASQAFAVALRVDRHKNSETNALAALESRTTIDLAVGVIMGKTGCTQQDAVQTLKNASSSRNIKLREIARGLIGTTEQDAPAAYYDH
ncbi:GAF and ANTAR domain-containing protein [Arthrobacter rhombi]|uniref:GAF and ANTAR domain-containing protein n=1 Tax=Arthrobacter rhombi TaxID=71253 RepID=UPI003FD16378